jgi:hypothetical protein
LFCIGMISQQLVDGLRTRLSFRARSDRGQTSGSRTKLALLWLPGQCAGLLDLVGDVPQLAVEVLAGSDELHGPSRVSY